MGKFNGKFVKYSKVELPEFSKHLPCSRQLIEISQNFGENNQAEHPSESKIIDSGIFQLQTIDVEGIKLNLFFDSGCGDIVAKRSAIKKLKRIGRAKQILSGPVTISGVGNQKSSCHDGVQHSITLGWRGECRYKGIMHVQSNYLFSSIPPV